MSRIHKNEDICEVRLRVALGMLTDDKFVTVPGGESQKTQPFSKFFLRRARVKRNVNCCPYRALSSFRKSNFDRSNAGTPIHS